MVEQIIDELQPDSVAVELCATRLRALSESDNWQQMDIVKVVREGRAGLLLANLLLSSFQRRMGQSLGVRPGEEMLRAVERARACDAELILADRDVQITLRRAWGQASWWDRMRLLPSLIMSAFSREQISEAELARMREQDVLTEMLAEFARHYPNLKHALIDERDSYLARKLSEASGDIVVAVIGAGHSQGMQKLLVDEQTASIDMEQLRQVPPPSRVLKAFKYGLPLLVIALFVAGFFSSDTQVSWQMLQIWILCNGLFSAAFTAATLPHPATVATAFFAAPFTSLNPMIAAGWVAGGVEAWLRKPKVSDFMRLSEDITSIGGFWKNEITKILLVVVFANIGSSLGTFIGLPLMANLLR